MTARAGGSDVVFLAATTNRAAADLVTRPTITTTDALRGKTLGVQSIGGTVYFRALLGLARLGLDPDRDAITIVQSGDDPTSAAALLSGAIDGAALAYTGSRPVKAQGYHAWDLGALNVPEVTGIISSRAVVRERPTDTRHLLQAIGASLAYIKSIDTDPIARERVAKVVAAGTGGTEEDVLFEMDASRAQLPVTMRVRREEAQELHDLVAASQPAVRDVKVEDVLDETLLDQLQSEGFFDTLARR
jgi:ABC-type nitrate/sulfonate/bicarbonate transport system substrate-binding protein